MDIWSPDDYRNQGIQRKYDAQVLQNALKQAHKTQRAGSPAVLSLRHLAEHAQVPYDFLRDVVGRRIDAYRSFPIKKRSAGYRIICVPAPHLLRVQQWIQRFVLANKSPHPSSHAYAKGCSPLRCAQKHVGCKWLIKIDIRRFFESIDESQVYKVFRECGYQALIAFEMARLTTRLSEPNHRPKGTRWIIDHADDYTIQKYRASHLGHLPQGAPTSPMLANLTMDTFDGMAAKIATEYGLTYTRYSDDLTFSSHNAEFRRKHGVNCVRRIYGLMKSYGLEPKTSKTNIVSPGARKVVLGLTVNDFRPRLTKKARRKLECHVYYVVKHGYVRHAERRGFVSALGCYHHLQGQVSYACQVDPLFGQSLQQQLSKVSSPF